jgi:hypothetical protein
MMPGATIRPSASITRRRARVGDVADRRDPPARDRHVGRAARESGAVDDDPAADHEVVAHRRGMLSRDRFRGR